MNRRRVRFDITLRRRRRRVYGVDVWPKRRPWERRAIIISMCVTFACLVLLVLL